MHRTRPLDQTGEFRPLRLVGPHEAVSFVARVLEEAGRAVERLEQADPEAPRSFGRGPVVWIARVGTDASIQVPDTGLWTFPCLFLLRPGEDPHEFIPPPHTPVESYDLAREPEDAPVLPSRIERLLVLHRRKAQTERVLHNLSDVVYTRKFDGTLTSINAAGERLFARSRSELLGRRIPLLTEASDLAAELIKQTNEEVMASGRSVYRVTASDREGHARLPVARERGHALARRIQAAASRERGLQRHHAVPRALRRQRRPRPPGRRGRRRGAPAARRGERRRSADLPRRRGARRPRDGLREAARLPAGRAGVLRARRRPARDRDPLLAPVREPAETAPGARGRAAEARGGGPGPLAPHGDARARPEEPARRRHRGARADPRPPRPDGRPAPRPAARPPARPRPRAPGADRGRSLRLPLRGRARAAEELGPSERRPRAPDRRDPLDRARPPRDARGRRPGRPACDSARRAPLQAPGRE